jgi:CheY-like chemotaxis protein
LSVTVPEEDIWLQADSARLVQVAMNLLDNSAKFTNPGGNIWLTVNRDGPQVAIRVRDTGLGIPPELVPHIFEMFTQVEDANGRARGGLGLGLNIVRTLVELHGGAIEARSDGPGRGAEFVVRLPALLDSVANVEFPDNHRASAGAHSRRVLIVDDNRDAARTLALLLTKAGFECRSVFDGHSALAAADDFGPDAVVLDLGMPAMSGLELARRLRARHNCNCPLLIAVTGWDKDDDRQRSREAGIDHHLAKPASVEMLRQLLGGMRRRESASAHSV